MTTLQSRPVRSRSVSGAGDAGRPPARSARPLSVTAAVSGAGAALGGLVVLQAIALTGWFLADGGAHGGTRDALRVGADAWLVGHGAHVRYAGVDYTVVPLGLTLLLCWAAYRAGAWAGRTAEGADGGTERETWLGLGIHTCGYVVVAVVAAVLAGTADTGSSLPLAVLGAVVVGGGVGGAGLLVGAGRTDLVRDRLPAWVDPVLRGALATTLGVLVVSAVLVLVSFALHLGSAMSLVSRLGLRPGDAVMLVLACAALAPNAIACAAAYLLGPGFAIGVGTSVSPSAVSLGPVPSFPLLAALPQGQPAPWLGTALLAVPPVVAALAVALVHRRRPARTWDAAALRGLGSGVLAALGIALLVVLAGGALGDGRMAEIGPSAPRVLVSGALALGLGGLAGGLAGMLVWRRTPDDEAAEAADEPTVSLEPTEPQVLVPARPDEPTVRLGSRRTDDPDAEPTAGLDLRELRARFRRQTGRTEDD